MKKSLILAALLAAATQAYSQSTPLSSPAAGVHSGNRTSSSDNPPMGGGNPPGTGVSDGNATIMPVDAGKATTNTATTPMPAGIGTSSENTSLSDSKMPPASGAVAPGERVPLTDQNAQRRQAKRNGKRKAAQDFDKQKPAR